MKNRFNFDPQIFGLKSLDSPAAFLRVLIRSKIIKKIHFSKQFKAFQKKVFSARALPKQPKSFLVKIQIQKLRACLAEAQSEGGLALRSASDEGGSNQIQLPSPD